MSYLDLLDLAVESDLGQETLRWQSAVGVRLLTAQEHAARAAYFDQRIEQILTRRRHHDRPAAGL